MNIFAIDPSLLVEGENTLAVEVHQAKADSSDLSFALKLDATIPETAVPALVKRG